MYKLGALCVEKPRYNVTCPQKPKTDKQNQAARNNVLLLIANC